jgi:cold shock CspA family protein
MVARDVFATENILGEGFKNLEKGDRVASIENTPKGPKAGGRCDREPKSE